ncbi:MAG: hypothetical protein ACLPYS_12335 [Vulcanimicrobiaceae bacterium]
MNEEELRTYIGATIRVTLVNGEMLQGKLVDLAYKEPGLYNVLPDPPHSGISTTPTDVWAWDVAKLEPLGRV